MNRVTTRQIKILLACVAAALALVTQVAFAATLAEYRDTLSQALTHLQQAESQSGAERDASISTARDLLSQVSSVELPDGTSVNVDNSSISLLLRSPNPDVKAAASMLFALTDDLSAETSGARTDPAVASRQLKDVLSRPEFQPKLENPVSRFVRETLGNIGQFIANLFFKRVNAAAVAGWSVATLILILAVLGVIALGLIVFLATRRGPGARRAQTSSYRFNAPPRFTSAQALEAAHEHAANQEYRLAVHFLYLFVSLRLDEAGVLPFDSSLTNRELLRRAATNQDLTERLTPLVVEFDRLWYGRLKATQESYAGFSRLAGHCVEVAK